MPYSAPPSGTRRMGHCPVWICARKLGVTDSGSNGMPCRQARSRSASHNAVKQTKVKYVDSEGLRKRLETFIGVCQLPQSPGVPIANSIADLRVTK